MAKKKSKPPRRAAARSGKRTKVTKAKAGKKRTARRSPGRKAARRPAKRSGRPVGALAARGTTRGLGAEAGGQAGDTEGISRAELADSESVEELLEEGQAFEAGIVSGVENAPDADKGGVRTRQVPEDDVPQEYLDED